MARRRDAVTFDDVGARRIHPDGAVEEIRWVDLVEVRIVTTPARPHDEDVYFVLRGQDDAACVIPQRLAPPELLERLQQLDGFDSAKVVEAMGSVGRGEFVCWAKGSG